MNFKILVSNFESISNDLILNSGIKNLLEIENSKLKIAISGGIVK